MHVQTMEYMFCNCELAHISKIQNVKIHHVHCCSTACLLQSAFYQIVVSRYRHDRTFVHTSQNGRLFSNVSVACSYLHSLMKVRSCMLPKCWKTVVHFG